MLRAFLRVEDGPLRALFERFARSPSGLVRDAVSHLKKLLRRRGPATFERRIALLIDPRTRLGKSLHARASKRGDVTMDKARAAVHKVQASQASDDHRAAVAALRRALKLVPLNQDFWNSLCYSLSFLGRWSDMLEAAKRATDLAPKSSYAQQQLACAYAALKDNARAIAAGRRAIALDPKTPMRRTTSRQRSSCERSPRVASSSNGHAGSPPSSVPAPNAIPTSPARLLPSTNETERRATLTACVRRRPRLSGRTAGDSPRGCGCSSHAGTRSDPQRAARSSNRASARPTHTRVPPSIDRARRPACL